MRKILTLILVLCTVALFAEMRGGALYDPGAVRSNLTNITSGSALSVANGGTGKTTAAEGLAALGGASLNGSSTVGFNALTLNGVAPLTAAEKTQALVGSPTVDFLARTATVASITRPLWLATDRFTRNRIGNTYYLDVNQFSTIATYTAFALTLPDGGAATVKLDYLGTKFGGFGGNHGTITYGLQNNAGTLSVIHGPTTTNSNLGTGLLPPVFTGEASGAKIIIKVQIPETYTGYNLIFRWSGYGAIAEALE